jgi:phenylacetate-coenzyme A ligase PaaK-like adenylate-forming protein
MTRAALYRWLVPRVVAPLAERCGLPVWTTERRLGELQWRSPEELEERALSMLRPLLAHAAHHVPHYHELLADKPVSVPETESVVPSAVGEF